MAVVVVAAEERPKASLRMVVLPPVIGPSSGLKVECFGDKRLIASVAEIRVCGSIFTVEPTRAATRFTKSFERDNVRLGDNALFIITGMSMSVPLMVRVNTSPSHRKSRRKVHISYAMQPNDHMSDDVPTVGRSFKRSGAAYTGVLPFVSGGLAFDEPCISFIKSTSTMTTRSAAVVDVVTMTLAGLRSRWTIPLS